MKKVLLTGASGFIGHHCISPLLGLGYEIHAISSKSQKSAWTDIHWHRVDLQDLNQISGVVANVQASHLIHLAWCITTGKPNAPEHLDWVKSSIELVRQFTKFGGKRVVAVGSCFEYDWSDGYCRERTTARIPATYYGVCKSALFELISGYSKVVGLSGAWCMPFFLFGPREHPERLVASVIRALLLDKPARCSHGEQIRDFLYVQDVADALVMLLHSDIEGPVNIGSGEPIALKDIIWRIGEKLQKSDLIRLGALPARANDAPLVVADNRRLKTEVGWRSSYNLDAGLEQTIEWWEHYLSKDGKNIK